MRAIIPIAIRPNAGHRVAVAGVLAILLAAGAVGCDRGAPPVAAQATKAEEEKQPAPVTPQQLWDLVPNELRNPGDSQVRRDRLNEWLKANVDGKYSVAYRFTEKMKPRREDDGTYSFLFLNIAPEKSPINGKRFAYGTRNDKAAEQIPIRESLFWAKGFSAKDAESIEDSSQHVIVGKAQIVRYWQGDEIHVLFQSITFNGRPAPRAR